ncbi:putative DNA helicase MCM9 isoform X1 [Cucumis melo var. makuwa]|uniref:Probable DNA helicase MCM9 n=1 Tax=Cucumis melo var. makuwa TaxID=1194695 RepID=A0A5D3C4S8_CUCMM|nr:putative DNA helicase MCM9 isoform X1 [Cucumis melo var. makuwa]
MDKGKTDETDLLHAEDRMGRLKGKGNQLAIFAAILKTCSNDQTTKPKQEHDVIVTGVLSAKWSPDLKDVRCDLDPMLIANHVRRTNELKAEVDIPDDIIMKFTQFWSNFKDTPLKGRNAILRGICPQVFGLFTVKLAVALTLIGGVQHVDISGTKVRGESHLLLVGDPGTGKSQFLKFAAKLSNRAVITTGLGSTSAGLTVAAVKDGGEWMLEAGALVLADGGLCCIDEVDSMREHDRATIHEAMEQQTISVAKAGLVTTLSTRTIVFGATNPKGHYDPEQPLSVNTTLSGPLLSRFDIVLVLLDTKNPEWDAVVSSHILYESEQEKGKRDDDLSNNWPLTMLRRYIQFVKGYFRPVLTQEAEQIISNYYQLQRRSAMDNAARTTVRMLESLIRLAQAHARLMFRNEVTRLDAITAILCIESSMMTSALVDSVGNALHSNFTENPDEECILPMLCLNL